MNKTKTTPILFSERLALTLPAPYEVEEVVDYYVRNRDHVANSQALMPEPFTRFHTGAIV